MCTETLLRFRRCSHTRPLSLHYCTRLPRRSQSPETGRACPKYEVRFRDSQESYNCFQ
ncbi:hypothetical protein BDV96DRAFT_472949, partial [Lophiotrema nucula]